MPHAQSHGFGNDDFRYRADENWPSFPCGGPDGEAVAVACASGRRILVFLRGPEPVQVFAADGSRIASWGQGEFIRPHGIFVDAQDRVICTDDFGHCVRIFTLEGEPLLTLGTPGQPSDTGATSVDYRTIRRAGPPFHYPTNIALGPDGDIFVADGYGNARIHRFAPDGRLIQSWGEPGSGPGQFNVPHGIAIDGRGVIYVADRENSRIQLFKSDGVYQGQWTDVARPCQITFDAAGTAFVAELGYRAGRWPGTGDAPAGATGGRVSIFDAMGQLLSRWGGGDDPTTPGDFFAPHDICVDADGSVYVAEVGWSAGGCKGLVPKTCHTLQKFIREITP